MQSVTKELVKFAEETNFGALPKEAIHEVKRVLLDSIGCALGGVAVDKGKFSIQFARALAGPGESTILGVGDKVSSAAAAFANGELINATDFDCVLIPSHVSPFVIPPPLALGESRRASGRNLIAAIALGHEIAVRVGRALSKTFSFDEQGNLKMPDVSGYSSAVLGGAIAAGKILMLDEEKMLHTIGIAGHMAPMPTLTKWKMTAPSAMDKYLPAGWASLAGVAAALLAESGYTGDTTVLDGDYGFWKFSGAKEWQPDRLVRKLGEEWQFIEISYKAYPCCGLVLGALDGFIEIIEENHLMPKDIEGVRALLTPVLNFPAWRNTQLATHVDAQFSVPYIFAVVAHRIHIADWQNPDTLKNPQILNFMKKVSFDTHPDFGRVLLQNPKHHLSSVEVVARGKSFKKEKLWAKGDYFPEEARMKDEELEAKFKTNASEVLSQKNIAKAIRAIFELEKMADISELLAILF